MLKLKKKPKKGGINDERVQERKKKKKASNFYSEWDPFVGFFSAPTQNTEKK